MPLPIMTTPFPPKSLLREHKLCVMESSTKKMFLFDPCTQNWSLCSQVIIYPHFPRGLGHKKPPWNVDLSRSKFSLDFFVFATWYNVLHETKILNLYSLQGNIKYQRDMFKLSFKCNRKKLTLFKFSFLL